MLVTERVVECVTVTERRERGSEGAGQIEFRFRRLNRIGEPSGKAKRRREEGLLRARARRRNDGSEP